MAKQHLGGNRRWQHYRKQQGRCFYCLSKFPNTRPQTVTLDHVIPKALGGKKTKKNIVVACRSCNQQKGSKLIAHSWLVARRHLFHRQIHDDIVDVLDRGF